MDVGMGIAHPRTANGRPYGAYPRLMRTSSATQKRPPRRVVVKMHFILRGA